MNGDPDGNGKGALVHGGTSLGRAVALELAKEGVRIALYDPGGDSAQARDEVRAAGGRRMSSTVPGPKVTRPRRR